MSDPVAKFERLMNLVAFLLASGEPVPFASIRKQVIGYNDRAREDAVEKRFDRDKKELRDIGIPVEYTPADERGRDGYYIPHDQYFLHELPLTQEEASLLVLLGNAARNGNDAVSLNLRSALLKLAIDSPLQEEVQEQVAQNRALAFARGRRDRSALDNLGRIVEALVARREIRFKYRRADGNQVSQRAVHPYGLGYRDGEWYLVGKDLDRDDVRQFKVVRIEKSVQVVKSRKRAFEVPADFDVDRHMERAPWEYPAGKEEWAEVYFHPDVAWMVADHLKPGWQFDARPDGSGVLRLKVRKAPDAHARLLTYLASFSADCAILKPKWLREQAVKHLKALRARYA